MDSGGGWFAKLIQLVVGIVIAGMVLSVLESVLCRFMPIIVITALIAGVMWVIVWLIRQRNDRW